MKNIDFAKHCFLMVGNKGLTANSVIQYLHYKNVTADRLVTVDSHHNLNQGYVDYADVIVLSPAVPPNIFLLNQAKIDGKLVVSDIELFARELKSIAKDHDIKTIGITGSNGKTTCAELTAYFGLALGFNTALIGNIGVPVLDFFLECVQTQNWPEIIVLELSSFQLESTQNLSLTIATVLNIAADHLDRGLADNNYGYSMLEYASIKANIFKQAQTSLLNLDDIRVRDMYKIGKSTIWFSNNSSDYGNWQEDIYSYDYSSNQIIIYQSQPAKSTKIIKTGICLSPNSLFGQHNISNILVAITLLCNIGDPKLSNLINNIDLINTAVKQFPPLPHRINIYQAVNCSSNSNVGKNLFFINDSKATNIAASRIALEACAHYFGFHKNQNACHFIVGGDSKQQDLHQLSLLCSQYVDMISSISIIGSDRLRIFSFLQQATKLKAVNIRCFVNLADAVEYIISLLKANRQLKTATVLLSPACSSLDQYHSYVERGDDFVHLIKKYYSLSLVRGENVS